MNHPIHPVLLIMCVLTAGAGGETPVSTPSKRPPTDPNPGAREPSWIPTFRDYILSDKTKVIIDAVDASRGVVVSVNYFSSDRGIIKLWEHVQEELCTWTIIGADRKGDDLAVAMAEAGEFTMTLIMKNVEISYLNLF